LLAGARFSLEDYLPLPRGRQPYHNPNWGGARPGSGRPLLSFHGMLSTAWPWPYAPEGLPKLTIQMDRADPFDQFDACGNGRFNVTQGGLVDAVFNLWDRNPVTITYRYLASNGTEDRPPDPKLLSY
jgi:hypothetical protein